MIAKHVPMRSAQKSDFAGLANYITDAQSKDHRLGLVNVTNCQTENLKAAIAEILATQHGNTRAENDKTYHLLVSFRAGENPSEEALSAIESRICAGIGLGDHQRISAVHTDTDNLHIHIAINKIHPVKNTIHEPYKAYKTLGQLCELLEKEFGLERDNHTAKRSLSEGRAGDMERHSGLESLVSWVRSECLEQMNAATSWKELHHVCADNGLNIKERGAGLVIETDGLLVKASTIDRMLSKHSLEKKLGQFQSNSSDEDIKPQKRYEKKPRKHKVNTVELYAKYKESQKNLSAERTKKLDELKRQKDRAIADAQRANKLRKAAVKLADSRGINKRHLYQQANKAFRAAIQSINKEHQEEKNKVYEKHLKRTWADWLKSEAQAGDGNALKALRARESFTGLIGNTIAAIKAMETADNKIAFPVDNITKKGTVIFRSGKSAIRDDGQRLQVAKTASDDVLLSALKIAVGKYGQKLSLTGTPEFKARIIHLSVNSKMPVTFADPGLDRLRLQLQTSKEKNHEQRKPGQSFRGRADSASTGITRPGAIANNHSARQRAAGQPRTGAGTPKPNVKRIGREPPPQSRNRLRGLSQLGMVRFAYRGEMLLSSDVPSDMEQQGAKPDDRLRRNLFGPRVTADHIAAIKHYIAEREEKRLKGFDIPKHSLYNGQVSRITFAGVRNSNNHAMVLLKTEDDAIAVFPVDKATAQRLSRLSIGDSVTVTDKGSIKTRGRSR